MKASTKFLHAAIFYSILATTSAFGIEQTNRIFYVGNSLTDQIMAGGGSLAASHGYTEISAKEWIPGSPLFLLWDQYVARGDDRLGTQEWHTLSLQPFDRGISDPVEGDSIMCMNFINAAKERNPEIQTYIYAQWMGKDESATQTAQDWNNFWLQTSANSTKCKKYYEDLVAAVRKGATDVKTPLLAPVGHVMYALNQKMMQAPIAGYTSVWDLYIDGIHLSKTGSYLIGITYLATLYKVDPRGTPVPLAYGTIEQELVDAIQQCAFDVVFTHPLTGATMDDLVAVSSLATDPASLSLAVFENSTLTPQISPTNAADKRVQWYSSNTGVAIVNQSGMVTGVGPGTATITIRSHDGSHTGTCAVTVTGQQPNGGVQEILAGWELNESNGAAQRTAAASATGVATEAPSLIGAIATGLDPTSDINNGLYGYGLSATNLEMSFGYQEYLSFSIAPAPGVSLNINRLTMAPMSQDAPAQCAVFSSINGIFPDRPIARFSSSDAPDEVIITGHDNIATLVEFRVYFYREPGVAGGMVGFGWRDGFDFTIEGRTATITGDTEAPATPAQLGGTSVVDGQAILNWHASSDNTGIRGYYVYLDDSRVNGLPVPSTNLAVVNLEDNINYSFTVSAVDYAGNESVLSIPYVIDGNQAPVASFSAAAASPESPLVISFDASQSADPDVGDYILGYDWDFGDGSPASNANAPVHEYAQPGVYTVSLRVMDNRNMYSQPVLHEITIGSGTSILSLPLRIEQGRREAPVYWMLNGRKVPGVSQNRINGLSAGMLIMKQRKTAAAASVRFSQ